MRYRCKHFRIEELVPPDVFAKLGEKAWELFDESLLRGVDRMREHFGPITINDWLWGGKFKESGYRNPDTKTGAPKSAHKRGKALDCKPKNCTPQEMYAYVVDNPTEFPEVRRVEHIRFTPTWFHWDTVEHGNDGIRQFKP